VWQSLRDMAVDVLNVPSKGSELTNKPSLIDRKSTRLNSSHLVISYAVFCLKKKKILDKTITIRFDSNVAPKLPWRFEPVPTTTQVKLGEHTLAIYRTHNTQDRALRSRVTLH